MTSQREATSAKNNITHADDMYRYVSGRVCMPLDWRSNNIPPIWPYGIWYSDIAVGSRQTCVCSHDMHANVGERLAERRNESWLLHSSFTSYRFLYVSEGEKARTNSLEGTFNDKLIACAINKVFQRYYGSNGLISDWVQHEHVRVDRMNGIGRL